jgi:3-phosphoshikimate 1-carboxyvinyltransferase
VKPGPRSLSVRPVARWGGTLEPPGDKSVTHRAYLMALLAEGESRIERPNGGADCDLTLAACERLGAHVARDDGGVTLTGRGFDLTTPGATIDCGNSGTSLRLLSGVLAAQSFVSTLDGDDSLRRRPVARVIEPLRRMGASLTARDGDRYPPLEIRGARLSAIDYAVPVASAQVLGCVLFAGLQASGRTVVALPGPARDHTQRMLPAFGVEPRIEVGAAGETRVAIDGPAPLRAARLRVPGDFSAAAFFLAAAAGTPGARVTARDVSLNPTRTGLLDVLEAMGARVERVPRDVAAAEPIGDVTVEGPDALAAFDIPPEWLPRLLDEVPAWTLAAAAARGVSRLRGAAELRVKESDRIAVLASQLARLGLVVTEHPDGLDIEGGTPRGGTANAAGDHRIAMTLALFGLRAPLGVTIDDAASITTSYPEFETDLRRLTESSATSEAAT